MGDEELHLHLYGCLDAHDLWTMGKDVWPLRKPRLEWFAEEYEKAWKRKPLWEDYWTKPDGFERLREDFEVLGAVDFPKFQACFNLIIALFPIDPDDDTVLRFVLGKLERSGLKYAELRVPLGLRFAKDEGKISRFFSMLARTVLDYEKESQGRLRARLAISVSRDNETLAFEYACLRRWLEQHKDLAQALVALDFSAYEESSSPETKKDFFQAVQADNHRHPETALAILYHVGESFQTIGIGESLRWVGLVADYGAHRLGHCISLGLGETELRKLCVNEAQLRDIQKLQTETLLRVKEKGAVIESCPQSNLRIAGIQDLRSHPLCRFVREGLPLVISSDDPGIFRTSLQEEFEFARSQLGISQKILRRVARESTRWHADRIRVRI